MALPGVAASSASASASAMTAGPGDANALVVPFHPKAMITILTPEDIETWLRGSYEDVVGLQRPFDPEKMAVRGPVFPTRRTER